MNNLSSANKQSVIDFSFLDSPNFRDIYTSNPARTKVSFYVGGVTCQKCVRKLEGLVGTVPGLTRLRVEMGTHLAHLEIDPALLTFTRIAEIITALGFQPVPLSRDQDALKLQLEEDRGEVIRLAVAGALAGNIMTFAFAMYLGGDAQIFSWLSFLLYLPVVTYVARPFYRGAWASLRQRRISIDLPMAVASLVGFGFSTLELLRGRPDVYFDSLSGFLFLILISRFVQKRLQRKLLDPGQMLESLNLDRVRVVENGSWSWSWLPTARLKPGQQIRILNQETLPADADLESHSAHFSLAWLSGESVAKTYLKGAVVPAGAKCMAIEAELSVRTPLKETSFGHLMSEVHKYTLSQNRAVSTSDLWAQRLLATVFITAIIFVGYYWHISPEQALARAIALVVLACPCAMAFGTPLALAFSLKKAARAGLVIRDAGVFEATTRARTIFLDKTGTLTDTDLSLVESAAALDTRTQKIILSLENHSVHPIAFALRKALTCDELLPVKNLQEQAGTGVSGEIEGHHYELKKSAQTSELTRSVLSQDSHVLCELNFVTRYRPETLETLTRLRTRGLRVVLLSGDSASAVQTVADELGFSPEDTYAELSPQRKAEVVAAHPNSIMVGDGINDSLALQKASVAIAASGGVEAALKSSDVYLSEQSLMGISYLYDVSHTAFAMIRQNLWISAIYNITGGSLALLGYINPMVAALLMPASSGFILLSTWLRSRQ